ncbi:homoserine kinase [Frankia sp. AgKG'84/4]|uniref:homoserine kinase n=1 Tax=Frankia sp. AgKG'84/4 TaxID=573490 RepID=UPI00200F7DC6|nr:homoserine kinase [Frankia sp. AgKG'84/4]MCL9793512.1 homoserine kinase [Frankia sp. AgKG'84/4]
MTTRAPARRVRVRVPATSANLGPGFDSFGLALALYDEVEVERTAAGLSVDVVGEDPVAQDETHLVVRAIRATFDVLGCPQPGLALRCVNRIPHGRGLGSSAAAIVAGITAAAALAQDGSAQDGSAQDGSGRDARGGDTSARTGWMLRLANDLEGHPDNVAAALAGGFTVAWQDPAGASSLRVTPFDELRPVVFVPTLRQSTEASRGALPQRVPLADAARTVGRAALLALTLAATEPTAVVRRVELLLRATEDVLHQPYRLPSVPATGLLVARLRELGIPATLSGSGPSVLALAVGGQQAATAVGAADAGFSVVPLTVDLGGAWVDRLDTD